MKSKNKEKLLKAIREKWCANYMGKIIWVTVDLSNKISNTTEKKKERRHKLTVSRMKKGLLL